MGMRNVVVQLNQAEYGDFVSFLDGLGFQRVVLGVQATRFTTKFHLLWHYFRGALALARQWRRLREIDNIVVFGYFAYVVKFFARTELIRYRKLFCFGFFIHGPIWFPICRFMVRLDGPNDFYLIFSKSEIRLYREDLSIEAGRMVYLPYGDWGQFTWRIREQWTPPGEPYYLAGGWSNRDYPALVEAFRSIPAKLLIVCSRRNEQELRRKMLPANIEVFSNVPSDVFEAFTRRAKAGIIPLRLDTGASGQSVALALMRNSKCVIASDVGALREYVDHGVTGFLLQSMAELPDVIRRLEKDRLAESMGRAGRAKYDEQFARQVVAKAFEKLLAAA
jgi:glycosyltransferase involved in cell wall biosynthesis